MAARKGTKAQATKVQAVRNDGWINALSGVGTTKDRRLASIAVHKFMSQDELDNLYGSDDVAAKIVDLVPDEMFREGYDIRVDSKELEESLLERARNLKIDEAINQAMKWGRLYGGALLVLGIDDGLTFDQPLNRSAIRSFDFVTVLDRWELEQINQSDIETDVALPGFGLPRFYKLRSVARGTNVKGAPAQKIHASRIIRFGGAKLPRRLKQLNQFWDDSILARCLNPIRNFNLSHDNAAIIADKFVQNIYKMANLSDLVGTDNSEPLKMRLQAMELCRSVLSAVVLDKDDEFSSHSPNISGLADLIQKSEQRLVVASGLPHTLILGESPSGLGATGQSEKMDFYDYVSNKQENELKQIHLEIYRLMMAAKTGPTNGKVEKIDVAYRPLWQQSEGDMAENRLKMAQADAIYLDRSVVDSEEIRKSRFGGTAYSIETTIDDRADLDIEPVQPEPGSNDVDGRAGAEVR